MAYKFFNIGKANAEIDSASTAIDAALLAAKITSINVDGKSVPLADAPLAGKISAYVSLAKTGDSSQEVSDLIVSNGQIADQAEKAKGEAVTYKAQVESLSREKLDLQGKLETANASVQTLTAKNSELSNLLTASNAEAARVTGVLNANNLQLSQLCVAGGCLDLTGEDGKALAKDATDEQKVAAAVRVPYADKIKAYQGAVNSAMAKTGVSFAVMPGAAPNASGANGLSNKPMNETERCLADVEKKRKAGQLPAPQR